MLCMAIRVFRADDHAGFSQRLRDILGAHADWVGETANGAVVLDRVAEVSPEVVLLDISLPGTSGLELAREIRATMPQIKVIFVSMHGDALYVEAALRAGASGYVLKSAVAREIVTAVEKVHEGGTFISHALDRGECSGEFSPSN